MSGDVCHEHSIITTQLVTCLLLAALLHTSGSELHRDVSFKFTDAVWRIFSANIYNCICLNAYLFVHQSKMVFITL